jgi:hypothetical protein
LAGCHESLILYKLGTTLHPEWSQTSVEIIHPTHSSYRHPVLMPKYIYNMGRDEDLKELAHPRYWDERYSSERQSDSHEWFRSFEQLRPFLEHYLPSPSSGCHILHLGCGSSVIILFSRWFFLVHIRRSERLIMSPTYRP